VAPAVTHLATSGTGAVTVARWLLAAALVLLAIGVVVLIRMALRRRRPQPVPLPSPLPPPLPVRASGPPRPPPRVTTLGLAGGGLAVASSGLVCPTCRTEYHGMSFCPRDARRLVPAEEMVAGIRGAGGMCTICGRAHEPGLRRCPHDGGDIIPSALYVATSRRRDLAPTGVMAKVCPLCRERADLSSRFCGRDGHELVVIN